MDDVGDKYWKNAKDALDKLTVNLQENRSKKYEFWKHITLIVATIIGFSVALFSQSNSTPNIAVIIALGLMLLDVAIGLLLIREEIDINQHYAFEGSISSYNNWVILDKLEKGEIKPQSEEYKGLVIANLIEGFKDIPNFDKKIFNQYAQSLAIKYKDKLPFQQYLIKTKGKNRWEDPVQRLFMKYFERIVDFFYLLTFVSMAIFFVGVLF